MKIRDLVRPLEMLAPLCYQESYDNAGLLVGNYSQEVCSALVCLDITEDVVDEAIAAGAGIIISHHPIVFGGLKRLTGRTLVERCVIKAVKHDIALYAAHTNLDAVHGGVSTKLAEMIGLQDIRMLQEMKGELLKLVTFAPVQYADEVRRSLNAAGAGSIGNYDSCSFSSEGTGRFRAKEGADPFVGQIGEMHREQEERIELILTRSRQSAVLKALTDAHPYEEVAYDLIALENTYPLAGIGAIGVLAEPEDEQAFLQRVKSILGAASLRCSAFSGRKVHTVALCGGSGAPLIRTAISEGADVYITGDIKYHDFFLAENSILLADAGHFETEQFTCMLIRDILINNFHNFAVHLSERSKNPIHYL
jgi:dinuclear metal center YbgI/SA1388 family protein